MKITRSNREKGATAIEGSISLFMLTLTLLCGFGIAHTYFLSSKMVRFVTNAAVIMRAVTQNGPQIALAPLSSQLIYNQNGTPSDITQQQAWYSKTDTGFDASNTVHKVFLNLALGQHVRLGPTFNMPPKVSTVGARTTTDYKGAYEFNLRNVDGNTIIDLKTEPTLLTKVVLPVLGVANSSALLSMSALVTGEVAASVSGSGPASRSYHARFSGPSINHRIGPVVSGDGRRSIAVTDPARPQRRVAAPSGGAGGAGR